MSRLPPHRRGLLQTVKDLRQQWSVVLLGTGASFRNGHRTWLYLAFIAASLAVIAAASINRR